MEHQIIMFEGEPYTTAEPLRPDSCVGCAFITGGGMCSAHKQEEYGLSDCLREDFIFERVYEPETSPLANSKPSNPKDIVGIRKSPMSTVSAAVLAEVGVAMLEGALKYGRHNYRAVGVRASVYYDGTMRHLMDWWEGVDIDPDSGMHHITKAITSLVVLRDAMLQGKCEDDRPPRSAPFFPELNARASALMDKYADRAPKHYTIQDAV